jgi:hypothetical protein
MIQDKTFFKFFFSTVKIFGLQPSKLTTKEKARALFLFLLFYVANLVLLFVKLSQKETVEEKIEGLQTVPMLIIMLYDAINFVTKSEKIEKLFKNVCETIEKLDDKKLFNKAFDGTMKIVKALVPCILFAIVFSSLVFLIKGEALMPVYTPIDHGPIFFTIWLIHSAFYFYVTLIFSLLDSFMFIIFNLLNANSIYLFIYSPYHSLVGKGHFHLKFNLPQQNS